jgi:hypothetical protein
MAGATSPKKSAPLGNTPIGDLVIHKNGKITPVTRPPLSWYGGKGLGDVRTISGEFLLSLQSYWEQEGEDILKRVGAQHPELIFAGMVKLANVMRVEVGTPGDFSGLSKQEIVEKLEQRARPKARKLFQKFISDMQKLKDEPGGVITAQQTPD